MYISSGDDDDDNDDDDDGDNDDDDDDDDHHHHHHHDHDDVQSDTFHLILRYKLNAQACCVHNYKPRDNSFLSN